MLGLLLRSPQRRATSSGSVSLNSPWPPSHAMQPTLARSASSSSRNCHSWICPLPAGRGASQPRARWGRPKVGEEVRRETDPARGKRCSRGKGYVQLCGWAQLGRLAREGLSGKAVPAATPLGHNENTAHLGGRSPAGAWPCQNWGHGAEHRLLCVEAVARQRAVALGDEQGPAIGPYCHLGRESSFRAGPAQPQRVDCPGGGPATSQLDHIQRSREKRRLATGPPPATAQGLGPKGAQLLGSLRWGKR